MAIKNRQGNMYKNVKTWNPFVGCLYKCIYCVASFQKMVKRIFYCQGRKCNDCFNFKPHTHPNRLQQPLPSRGIVWSCAHGDITFADSSYVKQVINKTLRYPYTTFYYQSKNPRCFNKYLSDFSRDNSILLTTLETNRDNGYHKISAAPLPSVRFTDFKILEWPRKIVTIEPIMDFDIDIFVEWIRSINPESMICT